MHLRAEAPDVALLAPKAAMRRRSRTARRSLHLHYLSVGCEVGWVGGWRGDAVAFRFQSRPNQPPQNVRLPVWQLMN